MGENCKRVKTTNLKKKVGENVKFHPPSTEMEHIHLHFRNVNKFTHYSSRFHPPQRMCLLMLAKWRHNKPKTRNHAIPLSLAAPGLRFFFGPLRRVVLSRIPNRKETETSFWYVLPGFILSELSHSKTNLFCWQKNPERVTKVTHSIVWHFLTLTNVTNGHTFECDWYKTFFCFYLKSGSDQLWKCLSKIFSSFLSSSWLRFLPFFLGWRIPKTNNRTESLD